MSQDQAVGEPIQFNYGLREIDPEEWIAVQGVLEAAQMQDYEVASDWVSPDSRLDFVLPENISPSLEVLATHAREIGIGTFVDVDAADPFLVQPNLSAESDLGVYLVWRPGQNREVEVPTSVVIAWGLDPPEVVGFA